MCFVLFGVKDGGFRGLSVHPLLLLKPCEHVLWKWMFAAPNELTCYYMNLLLAKGTHHYSATLGLKL